MNSAFRSVRASLVVLVVFSVSLCLCGSTRAGLDPEPQQPYKLQVVLHVAKHRQLTQTFQDLLESELRDGLQAALGEFARVEVVRQHPKLAEVVDKGLSVLDTWSGVSDLKTHFVLVDFVDGQYEVTARQFDGLTGQPSPVVRRDRTPDRLFVARTAALLLGRDFGLVGTVVEKIDDDTVRVELKGDKLPVPVGLQLRKDEVFALVQISQSGGLLRATRVPWALLQTQRESMKGGWECKLFHRHVNPLDSGPGILGYRCLKLATVTTAVRIRLVKANAATLTPETDCAVEVCRRSFNEEPPAVAGATDRDGVFSSAPQKERGLFENIAFVRVLQEKQVVAQVPVALVDDRTVVIGVSLKETDRLQLAIRRDQWVTQVYENLLVLAEQFNEVQTLVGKEKKREEAVERARSILEGVRQEVLRLNEIRRRLEEDARAAKTVKLDFSDGEQRLADLKAGQDKLQDFITRMEQVLKEEKDPKRQELKAKAELARTLEQQAEYGKALELLKEVIDGKAADETLVKHYNELNDAWQIKSEKHAEARRFIYETWATLEPLKVKDHLDAARAAFEECKKVGDKLSPRRLRFVALAHVGRLKEKQKMLDVDSKEEDRDTAKIILDISEGLLKLIPEINAFVDK